MNKVATQKLGSDNQNSRFFIITILTAMSVFGLLVYRVMTSVLLCDELLFVHSIDLGFSNGMFQQGSSHPPLIRMVIGCFANSSYPDWLLRFPSLCFSVATVFIWSRVLLRMIPDQIACCLILPAMAFNPVWLNQGYQCLPYAALTFFASLHCLSFLRMCEQQSTSRTMMFIASGIALPWTHFFGVNVLIADQFVWLILWWTGQASMKRILLINLSIAALTLPVVPIAAFYVWNDRPFPLAEVNDYFTYFMTASSLFFMMVSTPGLETGLPVYLLLYAVALLYLVRVVWGQYTTVSKQKLPASYVGVIAIGFLIAGFTATQAHSLLGKTAMYPRYMLAGSWVHLPLFVMLLFNFSHQKFSRAICTLVFLSSGFAVTNFLQAQAQDKTVAAYLQKRWRTDDAFLVQSMDLWHGPNHFDQLWFQRYVNADLPITTGTFRLRLELQRDGLPAPMTEPTAKRVWIYSHLFKEDWLRRQSVPGWKLTEIHNFGGAYPLGLLERTPELASDTHSVAIQPTSALSTE